MPQQALPPSRSSSTGPNQLCQALSLPIQHYQPSVFNNPTSEHSTVSWLSLMCLLPSLQCSSTVTPSATAPDDDPIVHNIVIGNAATRTNLGMLADLNAFAQVGERVDCGGALDVGTGGDDGKGGDED